MGAAISCVGQGRLVVSNTSFPPDVPLDARLLRPVVIRLGDREGGSLFLTVNRVFILERAVSRPGDHGFIVSTRMYSYRLLDRLERELLVYHWQPGPRYAGPDHPHLHVSASLDAATSAVDRRRFDLDKLHLPTGQVALAAVVRSLIAELGVEPLRPDWARVVDDAEAGELEATGLAS